MNGKVVSISATFKIPRKTYAMKYRPSTLNIASAIYILSCIIYIIINYSKLPEEEGWGIINLFALFGLGLIFLVIDFLLQYFIKDRKKVNLIGLLVTIVMIILYLTA